MDEPDPHVSYIYSLMSLLTVITSQSRGVPMTSQGKKKRKEKKTSGWFVKSAICEYYPKIAVALKPYSRVTKGNFLTGKYFQWADKEYYTSSFTIGGRKET